MLRDRLVCGIRDSVLQRRLLTEAALTFKSAVDVILTAETSEQQAEQIMLQVQVKPTLFQNCRFASVTSLILQQKLVVFSKITCRYCGKSGHIERACNANRIQAVNVNRESAQQSSVVHREEEEGIFYFGAEIGIKELKTQ